MICLKKHQNIYNNRLVLKRKTLVLDIDETLLHSTYEKLEQEPDYMYKGRRVYLRPRLNEFLEFCFANFEVGIWTSSKSEYAKKTLKFIVTDLSKFKFIWTRKKCTKTYKKNGFWEDVVYIKNLNCLPDFQAADFIMIDDTPSNIQPADSNIIMISEYRGELDDAELLEIIKSLKNEISESA
jgi:TFIIF-interacting CTD phosphatase-like protein